MILFLQIIGKIEVSNEEKGVLLMRTLTGFMKGVNLGGWVSQCGEGNYTKERFDTFITEKDIERIAGWGVDHVRMPIDYHLFQREDGSLIEEGFGYIDKCLEWCEKYHLNTVLDLHKTMGYIFDDKAYCQFFYNEALQDNFVMVWEEMTKRYGKYSDRVAFELLNEVTAPETAQIWNGIAARTIQAIRVLNKDIKIIIGGIYNSSIQGLELLDKPADESIVFTFHCYSPLIFTHQGAYWVENMPADMKVAYPDGLQVLREKSKELFGMDFDHEFDDSEDAISSAFFERLFAQAIAVGEKYDVPLYCGEYGVIDLASPEDTLKWFEDIHAALEKYNIGRAVWTYKEKDFGLIGEHFSTVLDRVIENL